jgi:hypothetical protein
MFDFIKKLFKKKKKKQVILRDKWGRYRKATKFDR